MSLPNASQCWRMPNELWVKVKPLLPPGKPHPLGCHRPRVDDREAIDAIFYRLRTGCQWKALDATGICSSSSTHRRFQEWTQAGWTDFDWHAGIGEASGTLSPTVFTRRFRPSVSFVVLRQRCGISSNSAGATWGFRWSLQTSLIRRRSPRSFASPEETFV